MLLMARCKSPFTKTCFPSATLIRLYKLLKNNSRLFKVKTGKPQHRFSSMLWFANLGVSLHLFLRWWRMTGSNRRPPACKAGALPAELIPHTDFSAVRGGSGWIRTSDPRLIRSEERRVGKECR